MPRLFVALAMPDEIADRLSTLCQGLPRARWTPVDQFHLTLRFIGEVDDATFCEIGEGLMDIKLPPFELQLKGLGHFPPRGEPRQLWVGVEASDDLLRLKRHIDRVVRAAGVAPERRKFVPHVTIARFRAPPPSDRLISYLNRRSGFSSPSFPVSGYDLLSSQLRSDQAEHIIEASYDFVCGTFERV